MPESLSRCPSCLEPTGGSHPCPKCGWASGQEPESPLFLAPNTRLRERYLLGRVLGHGGFGITYLAWDETLATKVAIKEYLPKEVAMRGSNRHTVAAYSSEDAEAFRLGLQRFLEEARTLARFHDHPYVISVSDYFEANNTAYLVMPYLEGMTLRDYLERKGGRLPYQTAEALLMRVLDGLRPLHTAGVLHRDISPDNIYLTAGQQVRLIDFGAARHFLGEHTRSLSAICKMGYSPEEQYRRDGKQGPWTDIYAAAATFCRALTGDTPPDALDRLSPLDGSNRWADPLIPPSGQGVTMPPHVEQALLKALAVRGPDRFQDVESFQRALLPTEPPPPSPPHWPWRPVLFGTIILLGGSLVAYLTLSAIRPSEPQGSGLSERPSLHAPVSDDTGVTFPTSAACIRGDRTELTELSTEDAHALETSAVLFLHDYFQTLGTGDVQAVRALWVWLPPQVEEQIKNTQSAYVQQILEGPVLYRGESNTICALVGVLVGIQKHSANAPVAGNVTYHLEIIGEDWKIAGSTWGIKESKVIAVARKARTADSLQVNNYINLARRESRYIGTRIAKNEGADKPLGLTVWREGEEHAEMGIGHFIWYPTGKEGRYQETFPNLLRHLAAQGVPPPDWLEPDLDNPWETREAFLADIESARMRELRSNLADTKALQVEFMIDRLEQALPRILSVIDSAEERAAVRAEFERVATDADGGASAAGVFALLDYVHFKGEGDKPGERYNGEGWGLLQVLQEMQRSPKSADAIGDFAAAAMNVLDRRIANAPPDRWETEQGWRLGWQRRVEGYLSVGKDVRRLGDRPRSQ